MVQAGPAGGAKGGATGSSRRRGLPVFVVLGLVKGAALGVGAAWLVPRQPMPPWLLAAALGAVVGLVAGRPFWREGAWVATILKGIVGFPVGLGAWWLARRFGWIAHPWIWLPMFSVVWTFLLELDDAVGDSSGGAQRPPPKLDAPRSGT